MIKISPSILSCDYGKMADELKIMEECGADLMHIDVMDGHFVPNITLGAPVCKCIKKYTSVPFDVHLMISEPLKYVEDFCEAGADIVCFHTELESDIGETVSKIIECGAKPALAIKPKTDIDDVLPFLDRLSMVLVMTVEPGFGGQSFMEDQMEKVRKIRDEINKRGLAVDIEVDGGINGETIGIAAAAGANVFVSGSALFGAADRKKTMDEFRSKANKAYKARWGE